MLWPRRFFHRAHALIVDSQQDFGKDAGMGGFLINLNNSKFHMCTTWPIAVSLRRDATKIAKVLTDPKEALMETFYQAAHEELIEQYIKESPLATRGSAYAATIDEAWQCCVDRLTDIANSARTRTKTDW